MNSVFINTCFYFKFNDLNEEHAVLVHKTNSSISLKENSFNELQNAKNDLNTQLSKILNESSKKSDEIKLLKCSMEKNKVEIKELQEQIDIAKSRLIKYKEMEELINQFKVIK